MALSLLGNGMSPPTGASSITLSYTCHSSSNPRKLVVWAGGEIAGGSNVNSVTYNSVSLVKYREDDGGTHNNIAMFYLDEASFPSTAGAYNLIATFSVSMNPGFLMVAELDDAKAGDPDAYVWSYVGNSSPNNTNITTVADNSFILACVGEGNTGTFNANSGQTILNQQSGGGGGAAYGHSYESVGTAGSEASDFSITGTPRRFCHSVCAIAPYVAPAEHNAAIIGAHF